jgi:hypothetical protein
VSVYEGVQGSFLDVGQGYFDALRHAGVSDDDWARATAAYASCVQAVQEAAPSPERQQHAVDAYRHYAETCQEIWGPQAQAERADAAYRSYLDSLRELLAGIDRERFEPAELAALAQSMLAVAWTASLCAEQPVPSGAAAAEPDG